MFLATTALEEFWDTSSSTVFLGEWCKLYSSKTEIEKFDFDTHDYVWDSIEKKEKAFHYCFELYKSIIPLLTKELNAYHNMEKDEKYYKTILGAWLLRYLFMMYDKYVTLKSFIEKNENFETILLADECYYIPTDYQDNMKVIEFDIFHLQQYSKILVSLGYNFKTLKSNSSIKQLYVYEKNNNRGSIAKRFFFKIQNIINKIVSRKTILLVNPYFKSTLKSTIKLFVKSFGKILLNDFQYKIKFDYKIDQNFRKKQINHGVEEFEKIINENILGDIPVLFIEGFSKFKVQLFYYTKEINRLDLIFTTNSLYGNELLKVYLAENKLYDKLLASQHGNSYGVDRFVMGEIYESSFSKYYYTWGWGNDTKFKYLPSGKLVSKSKIIKKNSNVLYVMTVMPRYVYVFKPYIISSDFLYSYLANTIKFLELFTNKSNNKIIIREYFNDYGWKIKNRILDSKANVNNISFNNKENIYKQIEYSSICIFDHFQTTALETLAMNKPTIIFIDLNVYGYREEAKFYIDKLIQAKILHTSPSSAFQFLLSIEHNVLEWWLSEEVQKVREEFCYNYARTSDNWADEWVKEFTKVLEE